MRRLLSLLLLLLLLPASLLSCGDPVTEEEVLPAAEALIRASVLLNGIYLGEGIPTGEVAFENYRYADADFCRERGIETVATLKERTLAVYTPAVADILFRKAFTTDDHSLGEYRDGASGGIYVLETRECWYENTAHEYLFDTMRMKNATETGATVTLTVRITPEGKEPQERELSLPLVKTEDGWRCDKLTYVAYDTTQN